MKQILKINLDLLEGVFIAPAGSKILYGYMDEQNHPQIFLEACQNAKLVEHKVKVVPTRQAFIKEPGEEYQTTILSQGGLAWHLYKAEVENENGKAEKFRRHQPARSCAGCRVN